MSVRSLKRKAMFCCLSVRLPFFYHYSEYECSDAASIYVSALLSESQRTLSLVILSKFTRFGLYFILSPLGIKY